MHQQKEVLAVRLLIARLGRAFWVKARQRLAEVGLREDGWFQGRSALYIPDYTFINRLNQGVFTLQGVIFVLITVFEAEQKLRERNLVLESHHRRRFYHIIILHHRQSVGHFCEFYIHYLPLLF